MQHFGIIAHPVAHTLSPLMYEAGFREASIEADFQKFDILPESLEGFLQDMRQGTLKFPDGKSSLDGVAVSLPHKQTCIPFLDELDPIAAEIGAVNTIKAIVVNGTPKLIGYNTDHLGVKGILERALEINRKKMTTLKWKKILLLGAGGTAAACAYTLRELGAHTFIWNRTIAKARTLAAKFGAETLITDPSEGLEPYDFVINTTSVGLAGGDAAGSPLPISFWENHGNGIAVDLIYTPRMTPFLRDADRAGWDIVTGEHALVAQGVAQFELLTHKTVSPKTFFEAISSILR